MTDDDAPVVPAPVLSGTTEFDKVEQKEVALPQDRQLLGSYHLDQVADEIAAKGFQTVALQFPDELIPLSTHISNILQSRLAKTGAVVYILADTSYSPCCVDEIAAQHIKADVVVHFGHACLNPVKSMPVIYVFGGYNVDVGLLESKFKEAVEEDHDARVILMADPQYSHVLPALLERLDKEYSNIVPTALKPPTDGSVSIPEIKTNGYPQSLLPNRLHPELDKDDLSEYQIVFITAPPPSSSLILHLTTLVSTVHLLQVHGETTIQLSSPHTALMRRYKYVNMARTAATVGILINSLSLRDVHSVLQTVKDWITQAGKKYYTFVVGKPNVAKLANFEVVDVWCVLGCPVGGVIVDCGEYYKPIITPYELNLALKADVTWTGQWLIDFESVLELVREDGDMEDGDEEDHSNSEDEDDVPVWDPVTGKLVSTSKPLRRLKHVDIETESEDRDSNGSGTGKDLVARTQQQLTIRNTVSTAADILRNKFTWQGLGSDYDNEHVDDSGATVEQGRKGIARGYHVEEDQDRS